MHGFCSLLLKTVSLFAVAATSPVFKPCLTTVGNLASENNRYTLQGGLANSVGVINGMLTVCGTLSSADHCMSASGAIQRSSLFGLEYIPPVLLPRGVRNYPCAGRDRDCISFNLLGPQHDLNETFVDLFEEDTVQRDTATTSFQYEPLPLDHLRHHTQPALWH